MSTLVAVFLIGVLVGGFGLKVWQYFKPLG
jgi:hypothetical protein